MSGPDDFSDIMVDTITKVYRDGYLQGFKDGIAAAKDLIDKQLARQIAEYAIEQATKMGRVPLMPQELER